MEASHLIIILISLVTINAKSRKKCKYGEAVTYSEEPFWGNQLVTIDERIEFEETFGYSSALWGIPHSSSTRYPIASLSKLFTAVAIHQLNEQGILDIDTPISQYLDESDLTAIGYATPSEGYCPKTVGNDTCQNITISNLLAMNSGIVAVYGSLCPYDPATQLIFYQYCQNPCNDIWYQPYQGSIASYISTFINAPLTFTPGDGETYEYSNANYLIAGYLIEKFSGQSYGDYLQEYIFEPLGLEDTFYDPFDGVFRVNQDRTDGHILLTDTETFDNIAVGKCDNDFGIGFWNAAAGLISTNEDVTEFYRVLFDKRNQPSVLFENEDTIKKILFPYLYMDEPENTNNLYFGHGVGVKFADDVDVEDYTLDDDMIWPELISMSGRHICIQMRMRLAYLEDDEQVIVSVFSNGRRVYVDAATLNYVYATQPECALLNFIDFETGLDEVTELLEEYTDVNLNDDYNEEEEDKLDDCLVGKENRAKIRGFNKQFKQKRAEK